MTWTVGLIAEAEGELLAMPAYIQARFLRVAELVAGFGPRHVGMPHIRHLEGNLWEMCMKGRDGIARAVQLARSGQQLIVLHAFVTKTQTTPRRALETARARLEGLTDD